MNREKNTAQYGGIGYDVTVCHVETPAVAEVKFQMAYHDWCKFERSLLWKLTANRVERLQKERIR